MSKIEEQISNLQTTLTEILIALDYRFTLLAEKDLAKKFKPLVFFYKLLDEYAILKAAVLIDVKDSFHVQKPYLKLLSDPNLNKSLSPTQLNSIKTHNQELSRLIASDLASKLTTVRNKYLAHNDLFKRESALIDMQQLKEFVVCIINILNSTCNELELSTIPKEALKINSLHDMMRALKDCR